jgi:hypothetical protein
MPGPTLKSTSTPSRLYHCQSPTSYHHYSNMLHHTPSISTPMEFYHCPLCQPIESTSKMTMEMGGCTWCAPSVPPNQYVFVTYNTVLHANMVSLQSQAVFSTRCGGFALHITSSSIFFFNSGCTGVGTLTHSNIRPPPYHPSTYSMEGGNPFVECACTCFDVTRWFTSLSIGQRCAVYFIFITFTLFIVSRRWGTLYTPRSSPF